MIHITPDIATIVVSACLAGIIIVVVMLAIDGDD